MDLQTVRPAKRKKKQKKCPNPLFLKWLEQWRDEAKSKESKLQCVYSKAIRSLKKYPLPLESGTEAMLLDGVGPSIAKRLDEELKKHHSNPADDDMKIPPPTSMITTLASSSICNNSDDITEPRTKKKKKTSPREYIPKYRSGPYAIIIALYKAHERCNYKGYMTKPELQQQAQPFAENSFTMPEPDSYYTAWSSLSTLIKKRLVEKAGSPARYHLTEAGHILAQKLLAATGDQIAINRSPNYHVPPVSRILGSSVDLATTSTIVANNTSDTEAHNIQADVVPNTKRIPESIHSTTGTEANLNQSGSSQDGYMFAFLADDSIANGSITNEKPAAAKKNSKSNSETVDSTSDVSDEELLMRPLFQRITKDPGICITNIDTIQNTEGKASSPISEKINTPVVLSESSAAGAKPSTQTTEAEIITIEDNGGSKATSNSNPSRNAIPEFELNPGSFEIILCVDFVETIGGGRKEEMVKELRMNGVHFDVRKLHVGDFLWIAQEKVAPIPGQLVLPKRSELVLDYIVERKRMDDLCSSIKDGRFKEQKFRLLNSGLRHPVYLVEDYGSSSFLSLPIQTLEQAIVNTQVGQGFFVKRTRDTKESAAYLTLMTRYLQNMYKNKTLKAIKKEQLELIGEEENQLNTFLMTFQELSDTSVKNRVLTVAEVFGKQLLQIPGFSAEKVVSTLESYPTLRHLLDAYEEKTTEKEKQGLLSELKYGKNQRKFGPTLSKTVYNLYYTRGTLS